MGYNLIFPSTNGNTQITGEAQAHADALRKLQAGHDEALGSAQQEAVTLSRELQGLQTEVRA